MSNFGSEIHKSLTNLPPEGGLIYKTVVGNTFVIVTNICLRITQSHYCWSL